MVNDSLIYAVIASLPWGVQKMIEDGEQRLERLLNRIDAYVKRYHVMLEKKNALCAVFPKLTDAEQHVVPVSWTQFYSERRYRNGSRALLHCSDFFEEDLSKSENRHEFTVTKEELFPNTIVPSIFLRQYRGRLGIYEEIVKQNTKKVRTLLSYR